MRTRRLVKNPDKTGLLNRAVLWHLQALQELCDRRGYRMVALHIEQAIQSFINSALPDSELSDSDLDREEHARMVIEMFEKYRKSGGDGAKN